MYPANQISQPRSDSYVARTPPPDPRPLKQSHQESSRRPSSAPPPQTHLAPRRRRTRGPKLSSATTLKLVSILLSLGLFALLLGMLVAYISSTERPEAVGQRMGSMAETNAYIAKEYPKDAHLLRVYTGLYIKSVRFDDSNSVTLSGYVWQRYKGGIPKGITPGVAFPEASNSYALDEIYREADVSGFRRRRLALRDRRRGRSSTTRSISSIGRASGAYVACGLDSSGASRP